MVKNDLCGVVLQMDVSFKEDKNKKKEQVRILIFSEENSLNVTNEALVITNKRSYIVSENIIHIHVTEV